MATATEKSKLRDELERILELPYNVARDRVYTTLRSAGSLSVTQGKGNQGTKPITYVMNPDELREYLYKGSLPETNGEILALVHFEKVSDDELATYRFRVDNKPVIIRRDSPSQEKPQEDTGEGLEFTSSVSSFSFDDMLDSPPSETVTTPQTVSRVKPETKQEPLQGSSEGELLLSLLRRNTEGITRDEVKGIVRGEVRRLLALLLSHIGEEG